MAAGSRPGGMQVVKLWHCGDRLWRPARPEAAGTAGLRHEKACTVMQVGASLGGASLNGAATMWQRGATLGGRAAQGTQPLLWEAIPNARENQRIEHRTLAASRTEDVATMGGWSVNQSVLTSQWGAKRAHTPGQGWSFSSLERGHRELASGTAAPSRQGTNGPEGTCRHGPPEAAGAPTPTPGSM